MFLMGIANFIISSNSGLLEQTHEQLIGIQQRTILAFICCFFFISDLNQYQHTILDSNACHYLINMLHLECYYVLGVQPIRDKFTPLEHPLLALIFSHQ